MAQLGVTGRRASSELLDLPARYSTSVRKDEGPDSSVNNAHTPQT
jgi:hypothetical protein